MGMQSGNINQLLHTGRAENDKVKYLCYSPTGVPENRPGLDLKDQYDLTGLALTITKQTLSSPRLAKPLLHF